MARFGRAARRMGTSEENARGILIRRMQAGEGSWGGSRELADGAAGKEQTRGYFPEYETRPEGRRFCTKENLNRREEHSSPDITFQGVCNQCN